MINFRHLCGTLKKKKETEFVLKLNGIRVALTYSAINQLDYKSCNCTED